MQDSLWAAAVGGALSVVTVYVVQPKIHVSKPVFVSLSVAAAGVISTILRSQEVRSKR